MKHLGTLVAGELDRLNKYGVFMISIVVALLWAGMLWFVEEELLKDLLPAVLLLDASMMCLMYIGAVSHFEKNESTISTLLVTPISNAELILSKVIAFTLHNVLNGFILIAVFSFLRNIEINYFLITIAIVFSTLFFTILGQVLSYYQKDFTTMLVNIMFFAILFMVPTALYLFGVLKGDYWEYVLLINPVQNAQNVIAGSFNNIELELPYYISMIYLVVGSILLYQFIAIPQFKKFAVKESGV